MSDFDLRLYRSTFRVLKRVLLAGALSGLGAASMPAWANATLRVGDTWSGSYRCAGQAGVLTLRFVEVPTDAPDSRSMALVKAELSFEEAARKGSLYVAGKYAAWLRLVALAPAGWIERPEEAVAMGFSGSVTRDGQEFKGRLERANCDAVTLTRGTREEVAAREAANPAPAATASVAGPGGSGVEIFGIRLGGPLSWAKCVGRSPRPCVMFSSSEATRGYHLIFGSEVMSRTS